MNYYETERQFNKIGKTIHEQNGKYDRDDKKRNKQILELKNTINKIKYNRKQSTAHWIKQKKKSIKCKI